MTTPTRTPAIRQTVGEARPGGVSQCPETYRAEPDHYRRPPETFGHICYDTGQHAVHRCECGFSWPKAVLRDPDGKPTKYYGQETIRVADGDYLDTLAGMVADGRKRNDPTIAIALSLDMLGLLVDEVVRLRAAAAAADGSAS